MAMDTIFALASAPGKAGVSVIRVSGPNALLAAEVLCGRELPRRVATLVRLSSRTGDHIDTAIALVFDDGQSFTGEATVEFQTHGSLAVTSSMLRELEQFDGLRPAEPGEFTRRALENDRLSLDQVEGLADLIDAETEIQRKQALRVASGGLRNLAMDWRDKLLEASALLEATIDFSDEEIPDDLPLRVEDMLLTVSQQLQREADGVDFAERVREGFEIAIVGAPNVGKSTLLNRLAGRDVAITSEHAGTTRDVIEVRMDIAGFPVTILDTAGIREADNEVEAIGVERATARARAADLRVFLVTSRAPDPIDAPEPTDIVVFGKSDLEPAGFELSVSGKTGDGIAPLKREIANRLRAASPLPTTATHQRHAVAISAALSYIDAARVEMKAGFAHTDIAAENLRLARRSLESLTGHIDVEHLLDQIFSSFCIGK